MSTARLLSGRPLVEFTEDGFRLLTRDLVVALSAPEPELAAWETEAGRGAADWRVSASYDGHTVIRVAAGLVYDGASIPLLGQLAMGSPTLYETAGVVHDALYLWQAPRGIADRVFWIIARSGRGVGATRGWLGWAGLRVFGWLAYRASSVGGETHKAVVVAAQKMKDAVP